MPPRNRTLWSKFSIAINQEDYDLAVLSRRVSVAHFPSYACDHAVHTISDVSDVCKHRILQLQQMQQLPSGAVIHLSVSFAAVSVCQLVMRRYFPTVRRHGWPHLPAVIIRP